VPDKNPKYPLFIGLVPALLLGIIVLLLHPWAVVYAWEKIDVGTTPTQQMFPHSDAVILKDEAVMDIKSNGEALLTRHLVIKIFSDPDKRYSHQEIPFNNDLKVISIKARTIHSNGDEFFLDQKDIRERSLLSEYVLYSDAEIKEFYLPRMDTNCVAEYEYQLRLSSLLYWGDWFFQSHLPTLLSRYTLMTPKDFDFKVKVFNDRIVPEIDFRQGKKVFVWKTTNKKAINKEIFMPPPADFASHLAFCPLQFRFDDQTYASQSWADIASWYWEISQASIIPDPEVTLLASQLTAGLNSKPSKIKAIFDFVQKRIRYISIAIGTGAYKPHPCGDVLEYGYGDCKDMTSLLIALLSAAEIKAYPALLSTRGHRSVLIDMPKVKQFDHVVVAVPREGGYIWLDPACRNCKSGQLPFEDQGTTTLVIKPDKGELITTSQTDTEENFTHTRWEMKLDSDGSVSGNVNIQAGGEEDLSFRASLTELKPQRRRKALTGFLASWLADPYLVDHEFRNFEEKDSNILIQTSFVSGGMAAEGDSLLFLPIDLNTQNYLNLMFPHQQRDFPVIFDFRFTNTDELILQIHEGFEVQHLPGAVRLEEPFGLFESSCSMEQDKIVYKRKFVRKELSVPIEHYGRLQGFYEAVSEADNQRIILKKNPAKSQ
jgi:hypothetical protein